MKFTSSRKKRFRLTPAIAKYQKTERLIDIFEQVQTIVRRSKAPPGYGWARNVGEG